jgi:hypothetical protein
MLCIEDVYAGGPVQGLRRLRPASKAERRYLQARLWWRWQGAVGSGVITTCDG